MTERLRSVAMVYRTTQKGTHADIRDALATGKGLMLMQESGFWTDEGRFVDRATAVLVGVAAGQLGASWLTCKRALLSCDVVWEGGVK